ncbi:MAG: DoxX family protein [Meiothermus sp.]|nr:DoxX family protein [Meiothermus sp.]
MVSPRKLDRIDRRITRWLAHNSLTILRISLGIVFFWFGVLKFFPAASPAEELAGRTIQTLTFGLVLPAVSLPVLAAWETLIGLGLITGLFMRATILLLLLQMAGTVMPLFLFPSETFTRFPIMPNLEGQYIIKNIVLVAAALTIGSTVRGGYIKPEPTER